MKKTKDPLKNWNWPFLRTNFGGDKEYACPHGIGHGGVHGCDGCCSHESYPHRQVVLEWNDNDEQE